MGRGILAVPPRARKHFLTKMENPTKAGAVAGSAPRHGAKACSIAAVLTKM
jgi:hypothetical protein